MEEEKINTKNIIWKDLSKRISLPTSFVLPSITDMTSVYINNSDLEIHDSNNRGEE